MAWIRVRKSRLLAVDDVTQVGIQKKGDQFYLEFIADRDTYVPVHSLKAAVNAVDAIQQGEQDITEFTIRKYDTDKPDSG
jgi:hypothetical protein